MQQRVLKYFRIISQVAFLYVLSECGKWLMDVLHIKFPGSIVGLILLFLLLITKLIPESWIASGTETLLAYMTLFFLPVTVGIVDYPELISQQGLIIMGIIVVITVLSIIASGKATQTVEKHINKQTEDTEESVVEASFETIQQKGEV